MEIPKDIIKVAFSIMSVTSPDERMALILADLAEFSLNDLLVFSPDNRKLHEISSKLHSFYQRAYNDSTTLAGILSAVQPYFENFFIKTNTKDLIIFLYVNSYLNIDFDILKKTLSISNIGKKQVNAVSMLVEAISFNINTTDRTRYYEHELINSYEEGLRENNLEKIYAFVLAIERGGRGFHVNFLAENLIKFLYDINITAFVRCLNRLKTATDAVFYLQSFTTSKIVRIMNSRSLINSWVIFEGMRQLTRKYDTNTTPKSAEINAMVFSLDKLYANQNDLYKQVIRFMHSTSLLNYGLGRQLKNITTEDVVLLFNEWLPLTQYNQQLDVRNILHDELKNNVNHSLYLMILSTAYNRWLKAVDAFNTDKKSYIKGLYETDYANFVIYYYTEIDEETVLDFMKILLEKLVWIDSEWFENESEQTKGFNMLFSHLYLLSYAYANKKLENNEIREMVKSFISNEGFNKRFSGDTFITNLATISQHVGC